MNKFLIKEVCRSTYEENYAFSITKPEEILNHPMFDSSKKTVLYIHGFKQKIDDENIRTMVSAYQYRNDHNILILDWIDIANGRYVFNGLPNTIEFSKIVTDMLIKLFANGLDIQKLHVVSHSLGSQLAGMVGRSIQKKTNQKLKLKRITCLDPAFLGFYMPTPLLQPINRNDAEFVDVIHTETGIYGTPFSTGTVDFWPNSPTLLQPGCPKRDYKFLTPKDLCTHWRSWKFWAESLVNNSSRFLAHKCSSVWDFKRGNCDQNEVASMGINCPDNITGDFYLRARAERPYSY